MQEVMVISIHATHTGGDKYFLYFFAISIHATHTGGDFKT